MHSRATLDVSGLPDVAHGYRGLGWWATAGFMVIEGTTLLVAIATYFYLRKNFDLWPPPPTPLPDLLIPSINAVLLLLAILPMKLVKKGSKEHDVGKVRKGFLITLLLSLVIVTLRIAEFNSLNTWWDEHAYGSAAWAVLALHSTLLFIDVLETGAFLVLFHFGPVEKKHFADAEDAAFYQYFLSLGNVLVYLVLFVSPRWI